MLENQRHLQAKSAQRRAYKEARQRGLSVFEAAKEGDAAYDAIMAEEPLAQEKRDINSYTNWINRHNKM